MNTVTLDESKWRLVPVEPTKEQLDAARDWSYRAYGTPVGNEGARGCYTAMLAAAPQPAAQATSDGWVAVSDRLPQAYEHVEVYPDPRDREHCYYASHDGGTNGVKAGNWYFNDRDGYDRAIHVTHWRPYSEPAAPDAEEVRNG